MEEVCGGASDMLMSVIVCFVISLTLKLAVTLALTLKMFYSRFNRLQPFDQGDNFLVHVEFAPKEGKKFARCFSLII